MKVILKIIETHIATHQTSSIRIQEYAVGIFKTANTKSAVKKAIKKKLLLVNDAPTTTARIIKGGERLKLIAQDVKSTRRTFILKLKVIYEDDHLAVIEKPAGILVSGNSFKTVDNALEQNLKPSTQTDAVQPRPVHRLDFPTTGLLLIGKTQSSIQQLNKLFEQKDIQKTYHAVTIGNMDYEGVLEFDIDGKRAATTFKTIAVVVSERFSFLNLVELSPSTGRRHQLRKHLSKLGNPILGDQDYGLEGLILKAKGLYLHASSLSFIHPYNAEKVLINNELPKRFLKIFSKQYKKQ